MRILNEQDQEITEDQVDPELGYLKQDYVFVAYHERIPEEDEQGHTRVIVNFEDGTKAVFDDGGYPIEWFNENMEFLPHGEYADKVVKTVEEEYIIDREYVPAIEDWYENEEIQRYVLYTEEELEEHRRRVAEAMEQAKMEEQVRAEANDRIVALNDLLLVNADTVGTYSEADAQIGDLTLVMADLIGA